MNRRDLAGLEKVARLKADLELRKYAALHRQVVALDARIAALDGDVQATAESWHGEATLADTRMASNLTRAIVNESVETGLIRARIEPAHEAAREAAARAWGRAEALAELRRKALEEFRARVISRNQS